MKCKISSSAWHRHLQLNLFRKIRKSFFLTAKIPVKLLVILIRCVIWELKGSEAEFIALDQRINMLMDGRRGQFLLYCCQFRGFFPFSNTLELPQSSQKLPLSVILHYPYFGFCLLVAMLYAIFFNKKTLKSIVFVIA